MKTKDNVRFPAIHAPVYHTANGTPYLKGPGIVLIARTETNINGLDEFINGFGDIFDSTDYLQDDAGLADGAKLIKTTGQLCYLSFGENRTKDSASKKYLDNLKSSRHGSVFAHTSMTFVFYGIDRAVTHELVRHGIGTAFSQVSQRYVDGKALRFVERPEYQNDAELHSKFESWIDSSREQYDLRAHLLQKVVDVSGLSKTDARKRVNQSARACLPNETEAPIAVTANARAWRHICESRANEHADATIRTLIYRTAQLINQVEPSLIDDYTFNEIKQSVATNWIKV